MARRRQSSASSEQTSVEGPVRTCVGCRSRAAKSELLRVVIGTGPQGRLTLVPDPEAVQPGRGAHLHPTSQCLQLAQRRRAFSQAFRAGEGIDADALREYLEAAWGETTKVEP